MYIHAYFTASYYSPTYKTPRDFRFRSSHITTASKCMVVVVVFLVGANTRWTGEVGPNINGYWWFSFTFFFSVSLFWSRSGKMGFNIGWTKSLSYDSSSCVSFDYWGYSGAHSRSSSWALANPLFQSITQPRGFRFWWEAISFCSRPVTIISRTFFFFFLIIQPQRTIIQIGWGHRWNFQKLPIDTHVFKRNFDFFFSA